MKCPKCQFENPTESRFCGKCGTQVHPVDEISLSQTETFKTSIAELSTGSTFAGRYQVIEEVGRGGMGRVYKVHDTEIKEKIALKLLKPEIASEEKTIERFRNELKYARKIGHRNVCRMYDLRKAEGTFFITMEYVSGEDLKSFIRRSGRLTVAKAVTLGKQICEGLAEAHRLNVVHRDLKPGNIMIDEEGNARIMDFGIARSLQTKGITGEGMIIGTPEYMSPEQAETEDVDHRSDIYSFGIILYEMLTGRVPFKGKTPLGIAMMHKSEKALNPKEFNPYIPDNLNQLILKCLAKDMEMRYQSTHEILAELGEIEKEHPVTEIPFAVKKSKTTKEITVTVGLKKIYVPALVIIGLAMLAFILWRIIPRGEVYPIPSDKPSLAVMYFKNNTGDEGLDHWRSALSDLLITDLSQSQHIRVMSAERLFNILDQLDQLDATTYSSDVLREVATQGGVNNIMVGNYTRADGIFRINVTLQDASTGELVGSESVEGVGERNFYTMVDELTRRVKSDFELSEQEIASDIDQNVMMITTSSPEAFKYYSEGRRLHLQADYMKSLSVMQKAIQIDAEFAMAYRSIAMSFGNMGYVPPKRTAIDKAFELSNRVSERERLLIHAEYYKMAEKNYDRAMEAYKRLLELYPDESIAQTNLGILYFELEDWDKAIEYYSLSMESNPANMFPYWNLAETYLAMGLYGQARETLEQYLEHDPGNDGIHIKIARSYLFQGEYDLALAELDRALSGNPKLELDVESYRGDIYQLRGNLMQAEKQYMKLPEMNNSRRTKLASLSLLRGKFKDAIAQLQMKPVLHTELAGVYLRSGDPEAALRKYEREWKNAVRLGNVAMQIYTLHFQGLAFLKANKMEEALRIADEIQELVSISKRKKSIRYFEHLMGMIELERGEHSRALKDLNKAMKSMYSPEDNFPQIQAFFVYSLANAYYRAGKVEKARKEYEKIISLNLGRLYDGDIYARSLYALGKICQEQGKKEEAREYFERFLHLWGDADASIPEVVDAKKRVRPS